MMTADDVVCPFFFSQIQKDLQGGGVHIIIRINEIEVFSRSQRNAMISGSADSLVDLMNDTDSIIFLRIGIADFPAVIR